MDTRNPSAPGTFGATPPGATARPGVEPSTPGAYRPPAGHQGGAQPGGGQDVREEARHLKASGAAVAGEAADRARGAASAAADRAGQAASQTASAARDQAARLAGQAKEQGMALIEQQKERAAATADDVSAAVRRAAEKLRQENDENLAGYAEAIADGAGSVARYMRQTDPGTMCRHVGHLTRRHPEWVLGGAYVAGLAIARFLKAQRPDDGYPDAGSHTYRRGSGGVAGGASGGAGETEGARTFVATAVVTPPSPAITPPAPGGPLAPGAPQGAATGTTPAFHPKPEMH